MAKDSDSIVPVERIEKGILYIRKQKVMLDSDLAYLYGVATKVLNQAVRRNIERFPTDFMSKLTKEEKDELVTNCDHLKSLKYSKALPFAFTEQGIAMLSSILRSRQAVEVNIAIMRTFVRLRRILADNGLLRQKIEAMERKYDEQFQQVFTVLRQMLADDAQPKPQIGYHIEAKNEKKTPKETRQGQKKKILTIRYVIPRRTI